MRHTLSMIIQNDPGALQRCIGVIRRAGFRFESLAMTMAEDPDLAELTVTVRGDEAVVQLQNQLQKQVSVIEVGCPVTVRVDTGRS